MQNGQQGAENKVLSHVSMGSTQFMVKSLPSADEEGIVSEDLAVSIQEISQGNWSIPCIILGAPSPTGIPLAVWHLPCKSSQSTQKYELYGSFGWGGGALKQAGDILVPSKMEVVGTLQVKGKPREEDLKKIEDIGRELAQKMKTT